MVSNTPNAGVTLPPELQKKLEEQAKKRGVSLDEVINGLLAQAVSVPPMELEPDEERKVTLAAEAHYRALKRIRDEEEAAAGVAKEAKKKNKFGLLEW